MPVLAHRLPTEPACLAVLEELADRFAGGRCVDFHDADLAGNGPGVDQLGRGVPRSLIECFADLLAS